MPRPFVVGNWKMHKTVAEALALVTELKNQLASLRDVGVGAVRAVRGGARWRRRPDRGRGPRADR